MSQGFTVTELFLLDYLYETDSDDEYVFESSASVKFKEKHNKNERLRQIGEIIRKIVREGNLKPDWIKTNYSLLSDVLVRYSRDVWSAKRLDAIIKQSKTPFYNDIKVAIDNSGLKITSKAPYLHRQCAFLLYWLCQLKPFYYDPQCTVPAKEFNAECTNVNEIISLNIIKGIFMKYNCCFNMKDEAETELIRDLHYRQINRSSLEQTLCNVVSYSPIYK